MNKSKPQLQFRRVATLPIILQDERAECGQACVAMVSHYFGHDTELDDTHTLFVKLAIKHYRHNCLFWFTADMPTQQINSIYLSNDDYCWFSESRWNQLKIILSDSFWPNGLANTTPKTV